MADASNDLFSQLAPYSWRGIQFPTRRFRVSMRQDLAEHKYPDRDGAHIEATGRCPLQFTATIPFKNSVAPGSSETFGVLYPTTFRQFFLACADRSDGVLGHPELGSITAKCVTLEAEWSAEARDGTEVEMVWVESTEDPLQSKAFIASDSPITTATLASLDMDTQIGQMAPGTPVQNLTGTPATFSSSVLALQGAIDQVSLYNLQFTGQIDQVVYRANALQASLDRATSPTPLDWPVRLSAHKIMAAGLALKKTLGTANKTVSLYTMPFDGTFGLVAATLGSYVADLMALNPALIAAGIITAGTVVRYYPQTQAA